MKYFLNIILLLLLTVGIASGADVFANRVGETTSTSGTGTISLIGAKTGYRTFVSTVGDGNTCKYLIINSAGAWEIGSGTVTDAGTDTLSRDSVESSINADALVDFSSGVKDVYCMLTAEQVESFLQDASEVLIIDTNGYTDETTVEGWLDELDALIQAIVSYPGYVFGTGSGDMLEGDNYAEIEANTTDSHAPGSDNQWN